jgi:purine nucleosidase
MAEASHGGRRRAKFTEMASPRDARRGKSRPMKYRTSIPSLASWIPLFAAIGLAACGGGGDGGDTSTASSSSGDTTGSTSGTGGGASGSTSAGTGTGTGGAGAVPVVIADIDADYDDIAALGYLCQEHKLGHLSLKAVTVTVAGAGRPGKAIQHARCMLEQCGLTSVPVADSTAVGANIFPVAIRDDVDAVLGAVFSTCTQSAEPSKTSAPDLIAATAAASASKVTLLTFGPLTNVALALAKDGKLKERVERVSVMGGAVHVPGNLCCGAEKGFSMTPEFNIWSDPVAAQASFQAFGPLLELVSLDATQFVPVTTTFLQKIGGDHHTKEADVVAGIAASKSFVDGAAGGFLYWWDPLNAVSAMTPGLVAFKEEGVTVVQAGADIGQTKPAADGVKIRVGGKTDGAKFEQLFLETLNGKTSG